MSLALQVCLTTPQRRALFFFYSVCKSCRAWPQQREGCLTPIRNKRKVYFRTTQQRIASLGIEPEVSNFSITTRHSTNCYELFLLERA